MIRPTEPYGLPLNFTTLPQQLKKAGMTFIIKKKKDISFVAVGKVDPQTLPGLFPFWNELRLVELGLMTHDCANFNIVRENNDRLRVVGNLSLRTVHHQGVSRRGIFARPA